MNILVFNWQDIRNPLGGGAEVHFHEIFKRIVAREHSVTLFCSGFENAVLEEEIDGIRVLREGGRHLFNYHVPIRYGREFRHQNFDVVVDDINKIPFYTPLYVKEPLVGIVHHLFGKSIFAETVLPAALYVAAAERLAMSVYRRTPLAVVSESTRQEMTRYRFPERNLFIVPNCVDHRVFRPLDTVLTEPIVGYLGRLKRYKSVEDLLYAFEIVLKEIPNARLIILGDGDARDELERIAREQRISPRVDFLGYVTEDEKIRYLNRMKLVVNTSAKEGWGLTVVEANACGVPVIASDVPGLRDSVLDGKTGLLFEYGNVEQLAEKILLVLRDEHLRSRLATEALAWARTFDWEASAEKMIRVLEYTIRVRESGA